MKRYFRSALALALVVGITACSGQSESDSSDDRSSASESGSESASKITATGDEGIRQRIKGSGMFGEDPKVEVSDAGVAGLKEVLVNGMVIYSDEDGRYLIQGEILELETRYNLTTSARSVLRAESMKELDVKDAIVYKAQGETKSVLTVFTDVECGFCQKFHEGINEYTKQGIEVRYYPWPRSGPSGEVYEEMVNIWCAKDRKKALTQSKQGKKPADASCENPVEEYYKLGAQMGIQGTPAIFLEDGSQLGGYVPPEAISMAIEQVSAEAANNAKKRAGNK